jgi:nucleotide-binding universal stress UspA family protein
MLVPDIHIRKILYATDLSENAKYAFAYAVNLSQTYKAGLTIMHVFEETARTEDLILSYISASQWEEIQKRNEEDARAILISKQQGHVTIGAVLQQFLAGARDESGKPAEFVVDEIVVERGNPVEKIIEVSESRHCDLIVMGSRGLGMIGKLMLGSTVQRTIQKSKIPVLVVRYPEK